MKNFHPALFIFFSFCFSHNVIAQSYSFQNLKNIEVGNSLGDIIILPFNEKEENTFVQLEGKGVNEIKIIHNGDDLSINNLENNVLFNKTKRVDITIHVALAVKNFTCNMGKGVFSIKQFNGDLALNSGNSDVSIQDVNGEISLNTGDVKVNIENIKGNISLSAGNLKNGKISNVLGYVDINIGSFDFSFFNVFGNISINGASGTLNYAASRKPEFPINIKTNGASFDFNLKLSSDFKTISNKMMNLNVVSSFFPIVSGRGDINFKGSFVRGGLKVKQIQN